MEGAIQAISRNATEAAGIACLSICRRCKVARP
jgi:hypothetical protein